MRVSQRTAIVTARALALIARAQRLCIVLQLAYMLGCAVKRPVTVGAVHAVDCKRLGLAALPRFL
jgi:hypothetical protein